MERPRDDARILLVDDEQEWLDILSLAFADEHWIVDAVSSGREALARLRENRYDLVLCDMSMPGMTGIELLRHLQAGGDDTPFIIMTGVGTIRTAVEAMQFGAYNYITKPFRSDDLTALARQALEHGRMHRSLRRAENSGEEKEAPGSVFSLCTRSQFRIEKYSHHAAQGGGFLRSGAYRRGNGHGQVHAGPPYS